MSGGHGEPLAQRIDTLEEAYEFMLAYAARGRSKDDPDDPEGNIRPFLERSIAALDGLAVAADAEASHAGIEAAVWKPYFDILSADAARARASFALVLARPAIGSELIDNLNGSLHVRTLLTDLFLIDRAMGVTGQ